MADLDPVQIDGWVFRLHYWVTSTAIFAASAVAFAKQYFGDPIECIFVSIYVVFIRRLIGSTDQADPSCFYILSYIIS